MSFFKIYQFLVPLLLLPASYYLWYIRADQTHQLPLLAVGIPVVFAYVIPAAGRSRHTFDLLEYSPGGVCRGLGICFLELVL